MLEHIARHARYAEAARVRDAEKERARLDREAYKVPSTFYQPCQIVPAPKLAELRKFVLSLSEKRSPKWRFRLADDLVIRIQPKLTERLLKFDGEWLICGDPSETRLFDEQGKGPAGTFLKVKFKITADAEDAWIMEAGSWSGRGKWLATDVLAARQRVIDVFAAGWFDDLNPRKMLSANCMCCGKGLLDPISMARMIGPECFQSSSTDIPWMFAVYAVSDGESDVCINHDQYAGNQRVPTEVF